ncbi:MAG: DUF2207 domain-containing protein [Patescibacteria group bacterium]|jgi:uncharacterized membrane protein YgcG
MADELIKSFDAKLDVAKDGKVHVTETIRFDFGNNQKHGIFRDIPLTAVDGPNIGITVNSVTNETGGSYRYVESVDRGVLDIKIGDGNVTVTGEKVYVIDYVVTNAIRPFEDHDELYWNVTGNEWVVPIERVSMTAGVEGLLIDKLQTACFIGEVGSTESCNQNFSSDSTTFRTVNPPARPLAPGEGMTVVLGFPLGIVNDTVVETPVSSGSTDFSFSDGDWIFLLVPLLFLIAVGGVTIVVISKLFKKQGYKGPIVVQYKPPEGLRPIDVGSILDKSVDTKDISSVILDLAVRGYIKIRYTVQEIKFWPDKKDFELIKLKDGSTLKHPGEKILFELFFAGRERVMLSEMLADKDAFHADIMKIKENTGEYLRGEGYYDQASKERADKQMQQLALAMGVTIVVSFLISFVTAGIGMVLFFPAILYIILRMAGASNLAKQFTPKGIAAQGEITGFKEFLQLTEKDKLELLNAPKLEPETFEKYLPFAMALGVESQWAKKFEGLYQSTPNWYEDPGHNVFSSTLLIGNLQQFNSAFSQTVVSSAPKSSSSGFSGGSSGGGSGGGGGGSW